MNTKSALRPTPSEFSRRRLVLNQLPLHDTVGIILTSTKSQNGEENPAQQNEPYAEPC